MSWMDAQRPGIDGSAPLAAGLQWNACGALDRGEDASRTRLRIVVVLPETGTHPNWVARLLAGIVRYPLLELCAVVDPVHDSLKQKRPGLFQRLWCWLEEALTPIPNSHVTPSGYPQCGANGEAIAALGADVLLDLGPGFGTLHDPALARLGIWFLNIDTGPLSHAGAIAREPDDGHCTIGLFSLTRSDALPQALASARTLPKQGAVRSSNFRREKAVGLVLRELRLAAHGIHAPFSENLNFVEPRPARLGDLPGYITQLAASFYCQFTDRVDARLGHRPGMFELRSARTDLAGFDPRNAATHRPNGNRFFADPFLWQHGGREYCFFEVYDYAEGIGHIGVGRFEGDQLVDVREALRTNYHLSFPFLFEDRGTLYMIPETGASRRIEVWRCRQFPDQWELHTTALEGTLTADSTLNMIDGQWWLFTNIAEGPYGETNSELHLFKADGPDLRELIPHRRNPVVFDAGSARNGGRVMCLDGQWLRPAQDNSRGIYGYGLSLNRIDRLTIDHYAETKVWSLTPEFEPELNGCHHIDIRGDRVIIDVRHKLGGPGGKA